MFIALVVILVLLVVAIAVVGYLLESRRRERQPRAGWTDERGRIPRQKQREQLDIHPLDAERAHEYRQDWEAAQTRFADDPAGAIADADTLIEALMGERGYPVGDFDTQLADLPDEHADVLRHYRAAHEVADAAGRGGADTGGLGRAMVHYRALFGTLLDNATVLPEHQQPDGQATPS